MIVHSRVQDGVVVLDNGVRSSEGQELTVLAHATVPPTPRVQGPRSRSVLDIANGSLGSALRPLP